MTMWAPKQLASGRWVCENENSDTTDQSWGSEAEAAAWAASTNAVVAAATEARKAKAAGRAAKRAARQANMPTDILTSRGDGWEGNG
jgi:hypothetical protein